MSEITPLGWIAISIGGLILISTNLSLLTLLTRRQSRKQSDPKPLGKLIQTFINPWEPEDRQWQELSRQVKELQRRDWLKDKNATTEQNN